MNAALSWPVAADHWPWPAWNTASLQAIQWVTEELQGLPITAWEASVRLSPTGADTGRWLLALAPQTVSTQRLSAVLRSWGLVGEQALQAENLARQCHRVLFALEQRAGQARRKLYFEHALPQPVGQLLVGQHPSTALMFDAFKAPNADVATSPWLTSSYWRIAGWSATQLRQALAQPPHGSAAHWLRQALDVALPLAGTRPAWHPCVVRVQEADSARQGLNLRLYDSGLRVGDLQSFWQSMAQSWSLGAAFEEQLGALQDFELGWLHAGTDREHQPYLTVYCPLTQQAARAMCQGAMSNFDSRFAGTTEVKL